MTSVAICIPTFHRPEAVGRLLESLTRLRADETRLAVVVVDNDRNGSAEATIDAYRDRLPGLVYAIEDEAGISAARNRLVRRALELEPDFIVFVDDDEWVDEQWLQHLLATAHASAADVVIGPVLPSYADGTPEWLRDEGFFERPRFATGARVPRANTGNSMISRSLFEPSVDNFPRCLPVGEDTYFFERARRNGASIVWCDEALVHEHVPLERASVGWLLRRAFAQGATFSHCLELLGLSRRERLVRASHCLARLVQGTVLALPSALLGRAAVVRALRHAAGGAGGLWGLLRPATCEGV